MEKGLPIDERKSADHALSCRSIPAKLIPAGNRDFGPSLFLKTEMGERSGSTEGPLLRRRSKWGGRRRRWTTLIFQTRTTPKHQEIKVPEELLSSRREVYWGNSLPKVRADLLRQGKWDPQRD
jgi:hypothetical protein